MYRWLRNTHLILGLFGCLYILVFGISSVKFSHRAWFPTVTVTKFSNVTIPDEAASSARAVARELMDKHGMSGDLVGGKETPTGFTFQLVQSGLRYVVDYTKSTHQARVATSRPDFMSMLVNLHEVHGLWHENMVRQALAIFAGIVSLSLVILSLTGIYLWFKIHPERTIGAILLALSLGYSLTVMVLLGIA
jgi:hypothetical protein